MTKKIDPYIKDKYEKGKKLQDLINDNREKDPTKRAIDQAPCPEYYGPMCDKAKDRIKDLADQIKKRRKKECDIYKQCGLPCPYKE